jgi:sugar/nucleoside kinase (ribokinase family)
MLCCVGDLCEDIVVWPDGSLAHGSDTTALIDRRRGGSAANVAAFAASIGAPSRFIGKVGHDGLGAALTAQLAETGVDVRVQRGSRTGSIVVLVDPDGQRTMITDRGASTELDAIDPTWLEGIGWLHVPFYSLALEPVATASRGAIERARALGVPVSIDASSASLLAAYGVPRLVAEIGTVDVVFANADELAIIDWAWPCDLLVAKYGAGPAVLHPGGRSAAGPSLEPQPVANVVDTTGAGDAFAAGFITARLAGLDGADCLAAGHWLAARVLCNPGATLAP